MTEALSILLGYALGSIPFGLVLCFAFGYGDVRKIGSGNIGATNVLRTGNKLLALITLIADIGKGAAAVALSIYLLDTDLPILTGFGAILGHCFPIWLRFKGGKGVATTLGTLLAATPIAGGVAVLTWLVCAALFRISSLSALIAMIAAPIAAYIAYGWVVAAISVGISALVFIRHHENIRRLAKGEEPKIGQGKKNKE